MFDLPSEFTLSKLKQLLDISWKKRYDFASVKKSDDGKLHAYVNLEHSGEMITFRDYWLKLGFDMSYSYPAQGIDQLEAGAKGFKIRYYRADQFLPRTKDATVQTTAEDEVTNFNFNQNPNPGP